MMIKEQYLRDLLFQNTQNTFNYIQSLKSGNQLFIRKVNKKRTKVSESILKKTTLLPFLYINEVERELKRNNRQKTTDLCTSSSIYLSQKLFNVFLPNHYIWRNIIKRVLFKIKIWKKADTGTLKTANIRQSGINTKYTISEPEKLQF